MPDILTTDVQSDYLSDEAFASEVDLIVDRAERRVIGRYRTDKGSRGPLSFDTAAETAVQLVGWAEDENGPDTQAMDDGLLDALRAAIALVVEHETARPDEASHVESQSQGDRSVSFRDADLPRSVFAPLRPYDARSPLTL